MDILNAVMTLLNWQVQLVQAALDALKAGAPKPAPRRPARRLRRGRRRGGGEPI